MKINKGAEELAYWGIGYTSKKKYRPSIKSTKLLFKVKKATIFAKELFILYVAKFLVDLA